MKLATMNYHGTVYAGVVADEDFYAFKDIDSKLPDNMLAFIEQYDVCKIIVESGLIGAKASFKIADAEYLPPLPNPRSFRDFMGFEEHAKNGGRREKIAKGVPGCWYEFPVFYFSNHNSLFGHGQDISAHPKSQKMDFEFEICFIIGKKGRNITAKNAGDHILGFTVLNDWSARDIQAKEMTVMLGPAKGKDFATSIGPVIVTKDEIDKFLCHDDPMRYDMKTRLFRNGKLIRENNIKTIYHTFASMIERASENANLFPGDLFGSGTIGGGTIIEYSEDFPYLVPGDVIEMYIEGIGILKNTVT